MCSQHIKGTQATVSSAARQSATRPRTAADSVSRRGSVAKPCPNSSNTEACHQWPSHLDHRPHHQTLTIGGGGPGSSRREGLELGALAVREVGGRWAAEGVSPACRSRRGGASTSGVCLIAGALELRLGGAPGERVWGRGSAFNWRGWGKYDCNLAHHTPSHSFTLTLALTLTPSHTLTLTLALTHPHTYHHTLTLTLTPLTSDFLLVLGLDLVSFVPFSFFSACQHQQSSTVRSTPTHMLTSSRDRPSA